ncbi:hypothetical protein QA640_17645 [Bradyrhizobium sp. CB82]|uniref:hypothetical protein n=1 Tax=Bradyrhizobium sp. CB82 TaxID=3039159 RepID=UPI0024B1962D|nr:hypothetical protein [Bradyrhizobium sp. CB82]WFU44108.1 hypothetical protein QA640_17645 [Bradyrhizobium sp. CB82]
MDDYPEHLAPEFENSGAVKTPFDEWWPKVRLHFPNVPENVARYWLHEHWSHSPYAFLKSADYKFTLVRWSGQKLFEVLSTWSNFDPNNLTCVRKGKELVEDWPFNEPYRTVAYMLEHRDFPAPLIILDNRDGHVNAETARFASDALPKGYVLIEGHRRFNIGLYLQSTGRMKPEFEVWLMERR